MRKIAVFDFDKTLTCKDTNWGFFSFAGKGQPWYGSRKALYCVLWALQKARVISNGGLKNAGLRLFIGKKSPEELAEICRAYASAIELNEAVVRCLRDHQATGYRVIIATASLKDYVYPIFPDTVVLGSELSYTHPRYVKLKIHCLGRQKVESLMEMGIERIDMLYTDDLSDFPLATIADKINVVKRGEIIQCLSINDFVDAVTRGIKQVIRIRPRLPISS